MTYMEIVETIRPSAKDPFMVVVDPKPVGLNQNFIASFNSNHGVLKLHNIQSSKYVLGIVLAHELRHATDIIDGIIPKGAPPLSPAHLHTEMNAHSVGHHILNEITKGAYNRIVARSISRRKLYNTSKGLDQYSFTFTSVPGDKEDVETTLKNYDEHTKLYVLFHVTICSNIIGTLKRKLSVEETNKIVANFLYNFFLPNYSRGTP